MKTWEQSDNKTVGDVIEGLSTDYPHLDAVGDTGTIAKDGPKIAKFVTVKTYYDPKTGAVMTKDIQIVESYDLSEVKPNPGAVCFVHGNRFPCKVCKKLAQMNYGRW